MNKKKLREILDILSPEGTAVDFKAFDEGVDKLKKSLKEKIQAKTLDDVNGQLVRFKKSIDLEPVLKALKDIDNNFDSRIRDASALLTQELAKLEELSKVERQQNSLKIVESTGAVEGFKFELDTLRNQKAKEVEDLRKAFEALISRETQTNLTLDELRKRLDRMDEEEANEPDEITPIKKDLQTLRVDLIGRINNINTRHGDHANRNIAIAGNTSVLSRYTDINLKAGANVTLGYSYNDTTKYTDVTFSAPGGTGYQVPLSGGLTGTNTWTTAPSVLVIDGLSYRQVQTDGTVMWTGTTTTVLTGAPLPNFDIFSSA